VELVHIRTSGDTQGEVPLWQAGGRAFFTREIDRALIEGAVDVAVHSLKDLPTQLEPGVTLAALLPRADPRDALVSRSGAALAALPTGARIGTSSLRRRAFLARLRPDAQLLELRGNVPTRIERLQRGDYDAIVVAAAGLTRLGLERHVSEYLDPESFPPAVSQGVIGVCARSGDATTLRWLSALDDHDARLAASAERALLERLEGGCQVPLGALATVHGGTLTLAACVCALDGTRYLAARTQAPAAPAEAQALGVRLAEELLARGAAELMASERRARAVEEP
jgi:hydroxymethylbilane synthase